jgi:hypothetical protein
MLKIPDTGCHSERSQDRRNLKFYEKLRFLDPKAQDLEMT